MIHFRLRYETVRDQLALQRARVTRLRVAWRFVALLALGLPLSALATRFAPNGLPAWGLWSGVAILLLAFGFLWLRERDPTRFEALPAWLDRRLGLGELLVTAVEVDRRGPRTSPERWLLDDAATALAERSDVRRLGDRAVRREGEALVAALLIACGLALAWGWLRGLPPVTELAPAGFGGNGVGAGRAQLDKELPGAGLRPGLQQVAQVWSDHAALRSAARSLGQGDASAGARALRALADRSPQLSLQGSRDLADALSEAASALATGGQEEAVAQALQEAGVAMREGDARAQADALEELARTIESERGAGGGAPGALEGEPREREGPPAERLDVRPSDLAIPGTGDRGGEVAAPSSSNEAGGRDRDRPGDRSPGSGSPSSMSAAERGEAELSSSPGRARLQPVELEITRLYFLRGGRGATSDPIVPSPPGDRP